MLSIGFFSVFVNSIKHVFVLKRLYSKESDSYSIEIQCLQNNFSEKKTSYFWRLYHKKTYDIESERRPFKIFLPAWLKAGFVRSLKIKCVGGLMFCCHLIIGIFCELALACRSLADFEEYLVNLRRYVPI